MKFWGALFAILLVVIFALTAHAEERREVIGSSAGTVLATSTDALSTAVSGGAGSYRYEISFAVITTNSVVNLMVNDGVGTRTLALNGGTACTAGVLYGQSFNFPGHWTINVRVATLTTPVFSIVKVTNTRG